MPAQKEVVQVWLESNKLKEYFQESTDKGYDDLEEIIQMSDDLLDGLTIDVGIAEKRNHLRRFKSAVATKKGLEKKQTESISKTDKSSLSKSKFSYLSSIHLCCPKFCISIIQCFHRVSLLKVWLNLALFPKLLTSLSMTLKYFVKCVFLIIKNGVMLSGSWSHSVRPIDCLDLNIEYIRKGI